ncbi:MAG: hypothetical protein J6328_00125 [Bacilli bacterium]|nr:hypothetical protein [Bacilli bacterium]
MKKTFFCGFVELFLFVGGFIFPSGILNEPTLATPTLEKGSVDWDGRFAQRHANGELIVVLSPEISKRILDGNVSESDIFGRSTSNIDYTTVARDVKASGHGTDGHAVIGC